MKNVLIVGLIVIGIGAGFAGGLYFQKLQVTKSQVTKTATILPSPSPTPDASKFDNIKVIVKSFDGKKLVYTLEDKTEKTINDVSLIKVWLKPKAQGEKALESDWKAVKVGTKLTIASNKTTGQIMGVLVL